jgi:hypothetical protein
MLEYQPIPDSEQFSIGQRRALCRQCMDIRGMLYRIEGDPRSHRLRHNALKEFTDLALSQRDYGAMRLALDMWERLPAEVRRAIEERCEELKTPVEQARQATDEALRWRLDHLHAPRPLPEDATPKMRREYERAEAHSRALDQAYRNELRHRQYPYLTLVSVTENPQPARQLDMRAQVAASIERMRDIQDLLED